MDVLTADLPAVLEQVRLLHGAPAPALPDAGNALLAGIDLPIPGWPLAMWAASPDGGLGPPIDEPDLTVEARSPESDVRLVWLAETGHLLWLSTDTAADDLTVIVCDTPRTFRGSVCERAETGLAVWERAVLRAPLIAACPLSFAAWSLDAPRTAHPGGPALLADPLTRALDDALADQIRRITDPRGAEPAQTSFAWTVGDAEFEVPGVFAATATERHYPPGAAIPVADLKHFIFLSRIGTWVTYSSRGEASVLREFDTVRDLYRFQIAGRGEADVFTQMWRNLVGRHPIARDAERNPLTRWARPANHDAPAT
jgi:hypothetical protein